MIKTLKMVKTGTGNLELSIPKEEDRKEVKEFVEKTGKLEAYDSLVEQHSSYFIIDPCYFDIGLTTDPYIVACGDVHHHEATEDGFNFKGVMYSFPNYMTVSPVDMLIRGETVTLYRFMDTNKKYVNVLAK